MSKNLRKNSSKRRSRNAQLSRAIDLKLSEIKRTLNESHSHNEEMAQLGEEIRRMMGKIRKELNIAAA